MKILVTAAVDAGANDASSLHVGSIADFLCRAGHEVCLVIPEPLGGHLSYPLERTGVHVIRHFYLKRLSALLPNTMNIFVSMPIVLWLVWFRGFRTVYVRNSVLGFILIGCARLLTNAVIVSEHNGWVADEGKLRGQSKFVQLMERCFQTLEARFSHHCLAVSPLTRDKLIAAGCPADKVFVGENGTDLERMKPIDRDVAIRAMGLDPARSYIGFLGNLAYWQGVQHLIAGFAICARARPNWDLVIVGDGMERGRLEALVDEEGIGERVHFQGAVPIVDANLAVNTFEIAAAPFIRERNSESGCSPIKIRDYAASGRPTVSSRIPAVMEHSSEDWLALYEPDDVEELAAVLARLMDDPEARRQMGARARAYAEEHYSWSNVAGEIVRRIDTTQ